MSLCYTQAERQAAQRAKARAKEDASRAQYNKEERKKRYIAEAQSGKGNKRARTGAGME